MKKKILEKALKLSWSKNTCYPPMENEWSTDNPALGQCYVTALVVQDYLGGKILKARFDDGVAHFWNIVDGKEVDLTRSQFDDKEEIPEPVVVERKDLEHNSMYKEYNKRYEILKERVKRFIEKNQEDK